MKAVSEKKDANSSECCGEIPVFTFKHFTFPFINFF